MNRFILGAVFLFLTLSIFAQNFKQAVGIRAGLTAGFEYRVYTDELNSYNFLVGSRERGLIVHALREFHRYELFEFTDQLNFVFGAGLHAGYERWDQQYVTYNSVYYQTRTAFIAGLDGLAGLEYMFQEVPISLGLEAKPYFDLFGKEMFDFQIFDFAFTAKYHF
jgi:hypothetical protein